MYDPSFRSCTMYIATVARERFGFDAPDLAELVHWADIIDGAQYPNAKEAVELAAPAMRLTLVIEGSKGSETVQKIIRMMRHQSLAEIAADPEIQAVYQPLYERHLQSIDIIRQQARCDDGVVFFDLVGHDLEGYNKFIPYYLFPESVYTVSVSHVQFPDQGFGGIEPLGRGAGEAQPGDHLRALRRRRAPRVGAISLSPGRIRYKRAKSPPKS